MTSFNFHQINYNFHFRSKSVNVISSQGISKSTTSANDSNSIQNKRHKKVLKIFAAIAFLFIFSNAITIVANRFSAYFPVVYIYFINNIGKPLIVYMSNDKFRKEVNSLLPKCNINNN